MITKFKKMLFSISFIFVFSIIFVNLPADEKLHYYEESLPIGLTPDELLRLDEIGINHTRSTPPPAPIRNCAEWEPSEGVIIRYPLGIPYSLVAEMSEDLIVTTIVSNTSYQNQATTNYTSNGVNMANVRFLIASTDSWWTRDYGPWFIFDGNDSMAIIDHIYNRPRPNDDVIPGQLGAAWDMTVYGMDLIATGGNHMSDGLGRSMSTQLIYVENPSLSNSEVDSIMYAFLNNDYTVLNYIESGGIHHIDCWAKFLNPTTIMVKDVPSGSSSYALLNARAEYLSQQISAWGQPYTIVRIYCPYGTAYTNGIILKNKVLVPTFNDPYDETALQTYRDAMPGYEVIGFDGSWYDDDAIHCRAMGVPDRGMLYIRHIPLVAESGGADYEIGVIIKAHSGADLIADSLKVFYRSKNPSYSSTLLIPTAQPDSFVAYIPAQSPGADVEYYIQAGDLSGRVETHPYIGPAWAHKFRINVPPTILSPDTIFCNVSEPFAYYPEYEDPDDSNLIVSYSDYPGWMTIQNDSLIGMAPSEAEDISFGVSVSDPFSEATQDVTLHIVQPYICGDANSDDLVNILDITFLIDYLYNEGPAPVILEAADTDASGAVNILDITTLIEYLYNEGAEPVCF